MSKNNRLLQLFTLYCNAHPEERFWQALLNWCGYNYLYVSESSHNTRDFEYPLYDTFHWEEDFSKWPRKAEGK